MVVKIVVKPHMAMAQEAYFLGPCGGDGGESNYLNGVRPSSSLCATWEFFLIFALRAFVSVRHHSSALGAELTLVANSNKEQAARLRFAVG